MFVYPQNEITSVQRSADKGEQHLFKQRLNVIIIKLELK